jgi:hypothetical protein
VRRAALALVVALAVLGAARRAAAQSALVVLISPPGGAASNELLSRARGELLADGFRVIVVDWTPEADRIPMLARIGRDAGAAVTAGLYAEADATTLSLYLVDALSGRVLARRLDERAGAAGQRPEVIARQTVDRLRASLLDFLVENLRSVVSAPREAPASGPRRPEATAEASAEPTASAGRSRFAIEAGLGVLGSFDGVGAAVVPIARARYEISETFQLRVTGAWLGTQPRVEAPGGTATVDQGIALAECVAQVWRGHLLRTAISLGVGAYYAGVTGDGDQPFSSERNSEVTFAVDGGVGIVAPLGSHFEAVLEAHALVTAPGIAIRFLDADVARIGRPSVLGTLSLAGWI